MIQRCVIYLNCNFPAYGNKISYFKTQQKFLSSKLFNNFPSDGSRISGKAWLCLICTKCHMGLQQPSEKFLANVFNFLGSWLFAKASTLSLINSVCTVLTPPHTPRPNLVFFSVTSSTRSKPLNATASPCPISVSWCYYTRVNKNTITFCCSGRLITMRKEMAITDTLHQFNILNKTCCLNLFQSISKYIPHIWKKKKAKLN